MKKNQLKEVISLIWLARGRMLESVTSWTDEQISFKPTDGAWSAGEILEHLHVVEFKTLQQIWRLKEETENQSLSQIVHANKDRSFYELISGLDKSLMVQAPSFWLPTGKSSASFWIEALKSNQLVIEKLPLLLRDVDAESIVFPHFLFGSLDVMQWLSFFPFHFDRHIAQIERLRQRAGFPQDA
jgi:hypothetical protein